MLKITIKESSNTQQERTYLNKDSKEYKRRSHGYAIAPIFAMAFIAAVTIGTTLVSTGKNFADFQLKANQVTNYDTASLATATEVARMSNDFLKDFRTSLRKSIASSRIDDLNSCSDAPASPTEEDPPANPPQNPQPNGGQPNTGSPPPSSPAPTGPSYGNYCQTAVASNPQMCNFSSNPAYQSYIDCVHQKYPGFTWAYTTCRNETGYQGPLDPNLTQNCLGMTGSMSCYGNPNMARRARTNNVVRNNNFKAQSSGNPYQDMLDGFKEKFEEASGGDSEDDTETEEPAEPECVPNPQPIYDNPQNIVERKGYFRDYANEIKDYKIPSSEVVKTLDYGLEQGREQVHSDRDFKLMGSIALAPQIEKTDPKYASMLIGKNNFDFKSRTFTENDLLRYYDNYTSNGLILLSPEVINALVDNDDPNTRDFFRGNEEQYGIKRSPNGIKFKDLVSGLDLDIEVVVKKPTETTPTKVTTATRKSVAQLRFATGQAEGFCRDGTPIPPDGVCPETLHCPVTNRVVQAAGACLNDLAAEGCPCFCDVHVTAPACENFNGNEGTPGGGDGIEPPQTIITIDSLVPGEYELFVMDPSAPIGPNNPLIVRRVGGTYDGNYVAIYPDAGGNIQYEQGTNLDLADLEAAGYQNVTFDPNFVPIISSTPSPDGEARNINVPVTTQSRKRIVQVDGGNQRVNGVPIPDGAVFAFGTDNDFDQDQNPIPGDLGDYHKVRIYAPDGSLIGVFDVEDLPGNMGQRAINKLNRKQDGNNTRGDGIVPGSNKYQEHDLGEYFDDPEAAARMLNDMSDAATDNINTGSNNYADYMNQILDEPLIPDTDQELDPRGSRIAELRKAKNDARIAYAQGYKALQDIDINKENMSLDEKELLLLSLQNPNSLTQRQRERINKLIIKLSSKNSTIANTVKTLQTNFKSYTKALDEFEDYLAGNRE